MYCFFRDAPPANDVRSSLASPPPPPPPSAAAFISQISPLCIYFELSPGGAFALCCVLCSTGLLRLRAARWGWRERGRKTFSSAPLFRGQPNEEEGDSLGIKRGIGPSVGRSLGLSELLDARRESGGGGSGKVAQSFPPPPPLSRRRRRRRSHIIPNKLLSKPGVRGEIVGFRMH